MHKVYAGVGSRETPPAVLELMDAAADKLATGGWTMRTGGALGADQQFWRSASKVDLGSVELYLPWPDYERFRGPQVILESPTDEAIEIAAKYHPGWSRLTQGGEKLHARNVHIILGPDVLNPDPVEFVLCWTRKGQGGGGTGQAIRIAQAYDIQVYDLGDDLTYQLWFDILLP